ncbi:uncharacterized protein KY384_004888 [Bacidia gigantensis]|uniref:uncharacterized protein n=1 Tax=Bacidia gigantensis TaxID=2732470 RepID=UPI001D0513E9|nr:uncharacterized protein KY384_004888 [Bacidia gigantensis]KAG8530386.1 hypothetical protein KY384_004888 [Bacidia gigantensis]
MPVWVSSLSTSARFHTLCVGQEMAKEDDLPDKESQGAQTAEVETRLIDTDILALPPRTSSG